MRDASKRSCGPNARSLCHWTYFAINWLEVKCFAMAFSSVGGGVAVIALDKIGPHDLIIVGRGDVKGREDKALDVE